MDTYEGIIEKIDEEEGKLPWYLVRFSDDSGAHFLHQQIVNLRKRYEELLETPKLERIRREAVQRVAGGTQTPLWDALQKKSQQQQQQQQRRQQQRQQQQQRRQQQQRLHEHLEEDARLLEMLGLETDGTRALAAKEQRRRAAEEQQRQAAARAMAELATALKF